MRNPTCPHCGRADGSYPLTRISDVLTAWLCSWCGLEYVLNEKGELYAKDE